MRWPTATATAARRPQSWLSFLGHGPPAGAHRFAAMVGGAWRHLRTELLSSVVVVSSMKRDERLGRGKGERQDRRAFMEV